MHLIKPDACFRVGSYKTNDLFSLALFFPIKKIILTMVMHTNHCVVHMSLWLLTKLQWIQMVWDLFQDQHPKGLHDFRRYTTIYALRMLGQPIFGTGTVHEVLQSREKTLSAFAKVSCLPPKALSTSFVCNLWFC